MSKKTQKPNVSPDILAVVMHELQPVPDPHTGIVNDRESIKAWKDHIVKCGHDAKKFFGNNGVGYEEYVHFMSRFGNGQPKKRKAVN